MFPKGFEWVVILIVALLIFGPKNLPKLGKSLGKTVKNLSLIHISNRRRSKTSSAWLAGVSHSPCASVRSRRTDRLLAISPTAHHLRGQFSV